MGLKSRIEHLVKFNKAANTLYVFAVSASVKAMGIGNPIQDNLILMTSDIGKHYTGSPRAIYERMLALGMDKEYEIVWAFEDPETRAKEIPSKVIELDSKEYFATALRAKYWITDVNIERGLAFKRRDTVYLNTWHGSTLKTLGNDIHGRIYYDCSSIDYMCVNSKYDEQVFEGAFGVSPSIFIESGLPKNDILHAHSADSPDTYKEKLGLPTDKKVILYAPTWRDTEDAGSSYTIAPPITVDKWEQALSDDCVLVFRMHPLTQEALGIEEGSFLRDFSSYQPLNDLMLASDLLITDYSSMAFDFSILRRPVLCFGYDYEKYSEMRGLYADLNEVFPYGVQHTEDELLEILKDQSIWLPNGSGSLSSKYNQFGGSATDACIELLFGTGKE